MGREIEIRDVDRNREQAARWGLSDMDAMGGTPKIRVPDGWGVRSEQGAQAGCAGGRCLTSIAPMTVVIPCINEKNEKPIFKPSPSPVARKRWIPLTSRGSPTQMSYRVIAGNQNT